MSVFAAALARLTPTFVESFDPEILASKFVRVEKEFGVKFVKSTSTFNVIGHWESVRKAYKSLLELNHNEKNNEKCSDVANIKLKDETSKCNLNKGTTEAKNLTDSNDEGTDMPEKEESHAKEPTFYRGKGNPRRGRQTAKESPYSGVPEPVFYLQYQDKTYTDACSLDIDSVLEDFEKSNHDKKVTKEDLKKILEKNKDQMGKPLEKGIPKGAILPVSRVSEDRCEMFSVEDMLNPIPPSSQMPSDVSLEFGMSASSKENSFSCVSLNQTTHDPSSAINMEMVGGQFNSSIVTTYNTNAKMSTQGLGMVSSINEANNQGINAGRSFNISDFYNHTVVQNGRLGEGVFSENHCSVNDREQVQLSESESDSFSSMFENYDPQAMLNQIPATDMMTNLSDDTDKGSQQVDTKQLSNSETLQENTESYGNTKRGSQNSEEIKSSYQPSQLSHDQICSENNKIQLEMHGYKQGDIVKFDHYTEKPINSIKVSNNDLSSAVLHGSETHSAVVNCGTDIISMAISAAHNSVDTLNPDSQDNQLDNSNTVMPSTPVTHNNEGHFLKSMPTGEEFMNSVVVAKVTEDQTVQYSSNEQSLGSASFANTFNVSGEETTNNSDMMSPVAMTTQANNVHVTLPTSTTNNYIGHPNTTEENTGEGHTAGAITVYIDNSVNVEKGFKGLVPECEESPASEGVVNTESGSVNSDVTNVSAEKGSNSEQNQKVTGKDLSPLPTKKSRLASKRVKKKGTDDLEKQKKKRKSKTSDAVKTSDGNKDGGDSDVKDEPIQTSTEKLDLDTGKSDRPNDKDKKKPVTKAAKEKQIYKCTECDYQGVRKKRLSEHMGRVHGLLPNGSTPENRMFSCDECEKTFVFEKDLSRHKKIVHHGQVYVCLVCSKKYKSKYVYDRHIATHEEGYVQPKFQCQICEQEFTTKFSLSSHIKSKHLGVKKTYSCPTCGKTFSQIRSYRQHANVHAGIRPYTCEVCGKSFTYDKSLKEHRYMHDSVRRFQCSVCQKAFRQQTCLLIHMKTHNETKDHICSVCGRAFTQKQSLLRHERIHTGDKPYSCKLCSKSFGDYAVIRKHIMMAHKAGKDGWKQYAVTAESKRSSHYIDGGPGYVPRESYAKINQKPEDNVTPQNVNYVQASGITSQQLQPGNEVLTPVNDMMPVQEVYQMPVYTSNLDFHVIANSNSSQVKQEDMVLNVNSGAMTSLDPDIYGSMNSQQQNIAMKSYMSNINASALTKTPDPGEDKYVAQFQNTPDLVYNVNIEKSAPSAFAVKDELLSSSVENVSIATSDSMVSGSLVTVSSTNNAWAYPGYSSAYFSPSSFSPYQDSPDTPQ